MSILSNNLAAKPAEEALLEAGAITVRAKSAGLKSGSVTITSRAFAAADGYSAMPPAATPVPLPAAAPEHVTFKSVPAKMGTPAVKPAASCFAGRHSLSSDK